jgi:hypothetical protein
MIRARFALPLALGALGSCCAIGDQVTLFPTKDNTIFSEGQFSNALGSIFSGRTNDGAIRRGLIAFDVASAIPAGSIIEDVSLTMNASKTNFGGNQSLHRLLADWGEGTSNAGSAGSGTVATEGDATWQNTFFSLDNPTSWTTPGGDFISDVSSTTFVPASSLDTPFQFASTPVMIQDVQHWLDAGGNFGWLIQGDENTPSAVRFDSREASFPEDKPFLTIQFSSSGGPPQWNVDADGSWGAAGNWSTNSVPDSPTAIANFLNKITAPRTITLDGDRTVATINFDSPNRYTLAPGTGGKLIVGPVNGVGAIHVASGSHLIAAAVNIAGPTEIFIADNSALILSGGLASGMGVSILKSGGGELHIAGPQQHGIQASFSATAGKVFLDSNAGAPATASAAAVANLSLEVNGNNNGGDATVILNAPQDLDHLSINYNDSGAQGVDLNSTQSEFHEIRIHSGDPDEFRVAMAAAVANAKTHSGDGLFDSGLHANSAIGIAVLTGAQGDAYVLVCPTRIGDLNLDGTVSISDFIELASHFGGVGDWQSGDLNGDGSVTIADFIELASNFGSSYAGEVFPIRAADQGALEAFAKANGVSLVPEPGALAALVAGAGILVRRRRR